MKRPLLVVSFGVLLISIFIVNLFPDLIYGTSTYNEGNIVQVTGKVLKIEKKTYSYYMYLKSGGRKILVTLSKESFDESDYLYGNTITAKCVFKEMENARNLGNYDEEKYLKSIGVCQKYKALSIEITDENVNWIPELLRRLKNRIASQILNNLSNDEDEAGVLIAMITGDRSYLSDETVDLYKSSGIAHILAISGLHISFVGMGSYKLLRKKFRFEISAACAAVIAVLYCIMSGVSASSIRAAIMIIVRLGAVGLGKKYDMQNGALLALILILLPSPYYINNSGFQLSFAAITGIAVLGPEVEKFLKNIFAPKNTKYLEKLDKKIDSIKLSTIKAASSSISVTLSTLPIILSVYYEFPLYGFMINMIILPMTSYLLGGGLSGSFAGLAGTVIKSLFGFASEIILCACCAGLKLVSWLCSFSSKLPFATICTGAPKTAGIIVYYALLAASVCALKIINSRSEKTEVQRQKRHLLLLFSIIKTLAFAGYIAMMILLLVPDNSNTDLQITFIDVDQGECIFINSPSGKTYMIDAGSTGTSKVFKYRIESALKYQGISNIDYLIVTHPDMDHISGVEEMLEDGGVKISNILVPEFGENETYLEILNLAETNNVPVTQLYAGTSIKDGQMSLKCVYPYASSDASDAQSISSDDVNDMSAVMLLEYGDFTALFTGDIDSDVETKIMNDVGKITLLDVAHHGSRNSSSLEFLKAANPEYAVISAGVDNSYGHPHAETLIRLATIGAKTYCTADYGEIIICVTAAGVIIETPVYNTDFFE